MSVEKKIGKTARKNGFGEKRCMLRNVLTLDVNIHLSGKTHSANAKRRIKCSHQGV